MNRNELHGDIRYAVGKVEKGIGDAVDSRGWQKDGVIDQVAGAAEHLYGRAKSLAGDAIDAAPAILDSSRDTAKDVANRASQAAQRGRREASRALNRNPAIWALVAAVSGYGLAWLVHGRD